MQLMHKIDILALDGNSLRVFLTVLEEESVSRAAEHLGMSQSAVSHNLDRLRQMLGDPLFVRQGRGIVATARARSLAPQVESIIDNLSALKFEREFDPRSEDIEFTIATNDFPLQLIFPPLLSALRAEGIRPMLHFLPSGVPRANLHRAARCQFLITPAPPNEEDIVQVSLFESRMECFYDANIRQPPKTWQEYIDCSRVEVRFSGTESSIMVLPSIDLSKLREPSYTVPNFSALAPLIKGTDLVTTQLGAMQKGLLSGLHKIPLPVATEPLPLYLAWHRRDHDDPAHQWLRGKIIDQVKSMRLD